MGIPRGKKGRPKKDVNTKKSERIVFRTTKAQAEKIENDAKNMNLTVAEYCCLALTEVKIIAPFTEDELTLKRGLVGMANNLNQIAHRANAAGIETVTDSAKQLFQEIRKEIMKFRQ